MDFKKLAEKTRQVIDDRGGVESVKEDALELEGIAKGEGSLAKKAKEAAAAIKEPGAGHPPPK